MSQSPYTFRYDYASCMIMKLKLADPDPKCAGKSLVHMTFEQALGFIRQVDAMTPGITKIYYLVGWQYNGHDDKYPDFFVVNEALKRATDATARDSLLWLHEAAKQYHSVVSLHINFNDAYADAPSFEKFKAANALIRKKDGTPHAIERYNGKSCYKTCFKGYWESGLFCEQIDRLLEFLPFLVDCGTVHVDNFQCYHNYAPAVHIHEMQEYRRKMLDYVYQKGIEITSEFNYKETERLANRPIFGLPREHSRCAPMDTLGLIPASWWCTRMTRKEIVEVPPQLYSGGLHRSRIKRRYLYGNLHGEDYLRPGKPDWVQMFLKEFALIQVPYHFLCTHKRQAIRGILYGERCVYSEGVVSFCARTRITQDGELRKDKDTLLLPYVHIPNSWLAYSETGDTRVWVIPECADGTVQISLLTPTGEQPLKEARIENHRLSLELAPQQALLLRKI